MTQAERGAVTIKQLVGPLKTRSYSGFLLFQKCLKFGLKKITTPAKNISRHRLILHSRSEEQVLYLKYFTKPGVLKEVSQIHALNHHDFRAVIVMFLLRADLAVQHYNL